MNTPQLFNAVVDGRDCTCITIGDKDVKLPGYLLQGKKQYGYRYHDGKLESWTWLGLSIVGEYRCICFDRIDIFPVTELFKSKRKEAFSYIMEFAEAFTNMDDEFLSLESGIVPIWRLYCISGGGVLILPQNVGDLITSTCSEDIRSSLFNDWVHYDIHPPFSLIDECTQLLYAAAAGFPPLANPATREDHCNAIPLSILGSDLPKETISFIDSTLHMNLTKQRDIAGNKQSQQALHWFLEKAGTLSWGTPSLASATPQLEAFKKKQEKRASSRIFWRKKGWIVAVVALSVACVGYFTYSRVKLALTPPYTYGMSDESIISEYFVGQTELDVEKLQASLAPHTKSPAELEVSNLFVTRQTRVAYEQFTSIISVTQWLADGKPAITEGANLYGITDVSIRKMDDDTYEVSSIVWTPYPYEEEKENEEKPAGKTFVYRYNQTQRFTFETNKKGWRLINGITNISYSFIDEMEVPTYPRNTQKSLPGAQTQTGLQDPAK